MLGELALGRLTGAARDLVAEHATSCLACAEAVAVLRAAPPLAATEHRGVAATKLAPARPPSSASSASVAASAELASDAPPRVAVGDVVDGKYLIEAVLGEGGMGQVLAATNLQLRQQVALKFMTRAAVENPDAMARFVREARAAARLKSEHICRVLDMGEAEGGVPYIVIEYLEGQDLGQVLARRGKLPPAEAVRYMIHACEGMAEAHAAGIIHRDLKPGNLFLASAPSGQPRIKVLDFGISKLVGGETQASVTTTRALMGSPLYMSPEQLMSARDVDARSDVWALGVVLFELVAGTTPFRGDNLPSLVTQVLHAQPRQLAEVAPTVPRELRAVIARCMDRDLKKRYASAAELGDALRALALEDAEPRLSRPRRTSPDRPLGWIAAGAVVVVAGAAAALMTLRANDPPSPKNATPPTETAAANAAAAAPAPSHADAGPRAILPVEDVVPAATATPPTTPARTRPATANPTARVRRGPRPTRTEPRTPTPDRGLMEPTATDTPRKKGARDPDVMEPD